MEARRFGPWCGKRPQRQTQLRAIENAREVAGVAKKLALRVGAHERRRDRPGMGMELKLARRDQAEQGELIATDAQAADRRQQDVAAAVVPEHAEHRLERCDPGFGRASTERDMESGNDSCRITPFQVPAQGAEDELLPC